MLLHPLIIHVTNLPAWPLPSWLTSGQVTNVRIEAVNWVVVRIKELKHAEHPEQFWAQGQGKARLGDDVPMVVYVGGTAQELCRAQRMPGPGAEQVLTHYLLFLH